jgi:oligo-1,6-glucosidase
MQWDASSESGFTNGKPWLKVNPCYPEINVAEALSDPDSIFYYYKKLIELRHKEPILREGTYQLYLADDPNLFVYERTYGDEKWLVVANFSEENTDATPLSQFLYDQWEPVIGNYSTVDPHQPLRPYEAYIIRKVK